MLPLMGDDVEGLRYPLHQPMDCSWQAWEQSLLTGVVLSHHTVQADVPLDHLPG
jgi:hypothetical protein